MKTIQATPKPDFNQWMNYIVKEVRDLKNPDFRKSIEENKRKYLLKTKGV